MRNFRPQARYRVTSGLLISAAGLAAAGAGTADTSTPAAGAGSDAIEEIVVTAQRRSERLMDVPMSVEAFGQEKLDQEGLRSVDDLTRVSPGVTFLRNGTSVSGNYNDEDSDLSIRGVDSAAGASTTGIYVDDTPIQTRHLNFGTVNPFPALFDLDRVEVLKGPQGTLFGAGSEGGTIRFITPEPSLTTYSGYARAEFGQIDGGGRNYEAGVAVGGPIIDNVLGFRVSASFREDGGWVDRVSYAPGPGTLAPCGYCYSSPPGNATVYSGVPAVTGITESNANWHDTATFRAALKWAPTDNLTVSPSIYVQTLHINDTGTYWIDISNPAGNTYYNGNQQRDPSNDPWYIGALKVNWSLPGVDLVSNTSYFSRQQHSISDYSQWAPTIFLANQYTAAGDTSSAFFTDHQNNFTEEVRASSADRTSPLQWTAGLYYAHVNENSTESIVSADIVNGYAANGILPPSGPVNPADAYLQPVFSLIDRQVAVFGEASYKFTEVFKATAGLRYSRLDYTGDINESGALAGYSNVQSSTSASDNPVTPRFVLDYQPDADTLIYASAAKGFRPGGINAKLPSVCSGGQAPTFQSDSLWHYELGTKNTLFERSLQVSASVYYLQWKNIQQFVYLTCGLGFDYNLGQVTGKGGDIEVEWRATSDLTLGLTGAYTDSVYTTNVLFPGSTSVLAVTAGDHLPSSPWNITANLEYVFNAVPRKPYLRLDYQYATAQNSLVPYQDASNHPNDDPTQPGLPEIRFLNLRAGLRFDGYDVSLFATNLFDYHTPTFVSRDLATTPTNGYPGTNYDTNYFGRGYAPRTVGITATYKF
jgi:outer membrane receptor protein involved in Fe transport